MPTSEAQKRANKKWNENNKEKCREICRKWKQNNREYYNEAQREISLNYWNNNKDKVLAYKKQYYQYKKECSRLCNILLLDDDQ